MLFYCCVCALDDIPNTFPRKTQRCDLKACLIIYYCWTNKQTNQKNLKLHHFEAWKIQSSPCKYKVMDECMLCTFIMAFKVELI